MRNSGLGIRAARTQARVDARARSFVAMLTSPLVHAHVIMTAGGFLQSAIFGTSGMRLVSDGLTFNPPPPRATGSSATMLGVSSFHFRGHRLSQQVTEDMMVYSVVASEAAAPALVVTVEADGSSHPLAVGSPVSAPRGRAKISLK